MTEFSEGGGSLFPENPAPTLSERRPDIFSRCTVPLKFTEISIWFSVRVVYRIFQALCK